jgi:hypothetical protein
MKVIQPLVSTMHFGFLNDGCTGTSVPLLMSLTHQFYPSPFPVFNFSYFPDSFSVSTAVCASAMSFSKQLSLSRCRLAFTFNAGTKCAAL